MDRQLTVTEFIQLRSKVRVSIKLVSVVGETEGRISCGEENESIRASNMNTQKFGKESFLDQTFINHYAVPIDYDRRT